MTGRLISLCVLVTTFHCGQAFAGPREDAAMETLNQRNIFFNEDGFIEAVKRGDDVNVLTFVQAGMSPDLKHEKEWYPLHIAAFRGYGKVVDTLVDEGAWVDIPDNEGNTALMFAAMFGYDKIAEKLLAKKAKVNVRNRHGRTALLFAVQSDQLAIVEMLLKAGADPRIEAPGGESAISMAARTGRTGVCKLLRKHGHGTVLDSTAKRYQQARLQEEKRRIARDEAHAQKMQELEDRALGRGKYAGEK